MRTLEQKLREEYGWLQNVMCEVKNRMSNAPHGQLRIARKRKGVEYYYKEEDFAKRGKSSNGRYMKKDEFSLVVRLAQRDYDKNIIKKAEERSACIDEFLKKYQKTSLKEVYSKTNEYRKKLISPVILSDEEYIRQWQGVAYTGKGFTDEENEIITERGERVRSKSEKIIADKLYTLGIPYRYEYPLILEENIKIYPDFTILRMPMREEVYLEHFGMMDDANYVNTVICKLSTFERNGIYLGINLFMTYETSKKSLNTRVLDEFIKELFCVE